MKRDERVSILAVRIGKEEPRHAADFLVEGKALSIGRPLRLKARCAQESLIVTLGIHLSEVGVNVRIHDLFAVGRPREIAAAS